MAWRRCRFVNEWHGGAYHVCSRASSTLSLVAVGTLHLLPSRHREWGKLAFFGGDEGHPSLFAPIMTATLSTCAQLERDNISFRLQSGRKRYIEKGGKLGRKVGSVKTEEQIKTEYREVISLLRKGYSIRDVAKLSGKGVSTVQRVKSRLYL